MTAGTDMMQMTAELASITTMESARTNTMTIIDAMAIAAMAAHGHAVEAGALRVTR